MATAFLAIFRQFFVHDSALRAFPSMSRLLHCDGKSVDSLQLPQKHRILGVMHTERLPDPSQCTGLCEAPTLFDLEPVATCQSSVFPQTTSLCGRQDVE